MTYPYPKRRIPYSKMTLTRLKEIEAHMLRNPSLSDYGCYETSPLSRIQEVISQKQKKEAKRKAERAVITAYKGKSRTLADQIKSELKKQISIDPHCPYCGWYMADDPHCDHIYPVSKGGLSTPQNMVYVCSDCNLKKNGLMLTQFIKKYCKDRDVLSRVEIEQNLERLGKEY